MPSTALATFSIELQHGILYVSDAETHSVHGYTSFEQGGVDVEERSLALEVQDAVDGPVTVEIYSEQPEQLLEFNLYEGTLSTPSRSVRIEDADRLIVLTLPGARASTPVLMMADSLDRPTHLMLVLKM